MVPRRQAPLARDNRSSPAWDPQRIRAVRACATAIRARLSPIERPTSLPDPNWGQPYMYRYLIPGVAGGLQYARVRTAVTEASLPNQARALLVMHRAEDSTARAKARAKRRAREGGAVMFIVAMTLAIIAAMGIYALNVAATEVKTAGYVREQTQAYYLSDYGVLASTQLAPLYRVPHCKACIPRSDAANAGLRHCTPLTADADDGGRAARLACRARGREGARIAVEPGQHVDLPAR